MAANFDQSLNVRLFSPGTFIPYLPDRKRVILERDQMFYGNGKALLLLLLLSLLLLLLSSLLLERHQMFYGNGKALLKEEKSTELFNPTSGFWDYQFCIVTRTCYTNICFHEFSMIYRSRSDFLVQAYRPLYPINSHTRHIYCRPIRYYMDYNPIV